MSKYDPAPGDKVKIHTGPRVLDSEVKKIGDRLAIPVPGSTAVYELSDNFFEHYQLRYTGFSVADGRKILDLMELPSVVKNSMATWDVTLFIAGVAYKTTVRALTKDRAMWGALESYQRENPSAPNKHLLKRLINDKAKGYDYTATRHAP